MDILGLMKQAKALQEKMQSLQESVAGIEAQGVSGGGLVRVTLDGKGIMRAISIDPSLLREGGAQMLEDLILAAANQAREKADALVADKTRELTAGLSLPAGLKLPF
jgi:DNA-binding YbaB/EbfC family protein